MTLKNVKTMQDYNKQKIAVYPVQVSKEWDFLTILKWIAMLGSFVSYGLIATNFLLVGFVIGLVVSLILVYVMTEQNELELATMYMGFLFLNVVGLFQNI
jgi:hypothetical protein